MPDEIRLLDEVKGAFQAALLTTYNVYFPFFEGVVLPALQSHGCAHIVLLMDAGQLGRCLSDPELAPRHAGTEYCLAPVRMTGAFHPKTLLLLGKRGSRVVIGSHNLTLSGSGVNREVSNVVSISDAESKELGRHVFDSIRAWGATVGPEVTRLIDSAAERATWLKSQRTEGARDVVSLGTVPEGPSLFTQLASRVPLTKVRRITSVGPFFDEKFRFLAELEQASPHAELLVGVKAQCLAVPQAFPTELRRTRFLDLSTWTGADEKREIHAKVLWFELESGESWLVTGSANPSAPAWLDGPRRNAELVLVRRLPRSSELPAALSLPEIKNLPEVDQVLWEKLAAPREDAPEERSVPAAWVAHELDQVLRVPEGFLEGESEVRLHFRQGTVEMRPLPPPSEGFFVFTEVAEGVLSVSAPLSGRTAVVLHHRELERRAVTEKSQKLRAALNALSLAGEDLGSILHVIERAILDEAPVPDTQQRKNVVKGAKEPAGGTGVSVGELDAKARHRKKVSSHDFALLIDNLIHRVAFGLDIEDAPVGDSEESLNEESAPQPKKPPPEEARDWIRQARRKTKRLANLIARVVEQERQKEDPNVYAVVLQSTAALGAFLQVARRGASADWVPAGQSLIDEEGLYHLFDYVCAYLFAPRGGLAEVFQEQFGDADEVATCRLLCLWAARRLGGELSALSQPTYWDDDHEDDLEWRMSILALALNVLDQAALPPEEVCSKILGEEGYAWLQRHLAWAEDMLTAPPLKEPIRQGSVVRFTRAGVKQVSVAIGTKEGKTEVVDRATGEPVVYRTDRLECVGQLFR